jgi:hypothetical protein
MHTYIDPPGKDTKEQRSISISERAQRQQKSIRRASTDPPGKVKRAMQHQHIGLQRTQKHQASEHGHARKSQNETCHVPRIEKLCQAGP